MSETPVTTAERKTLLTPFNIIAGLIILAGLVVTYLRFTRGIGAVTNLDQNNPWGLWIGFDLLCGVALAAGGYVTAAAVYLFGQKKYHSAVRPAVLTGFLGYSLVGFALLFDVGRPWRLHYPVFVQQGTSSVLFEVGLCVMLYLTVLFFEFTPIPLEWLGWNKARAIAVKLTLALTVLGVILSTMHQSSLGALYLLSPYKLHPLWYSKYIPVYFFISSIIAGLSMVLVESSLSHRFFSDKIDEKGHHEHEQLVLGFSKASALVLFGYFGIKLVGVASDNLWGLLLTPYGFWFMLEVLGFVLLPCFLFAIGYRERSLKLIRSGAVITVLGIILNRLNVSLIAFNWNLPPEQRYFPHWMEIVISLFIITLGVIAFRFIVSRMPVLKEHPDYQESH